MEYVSLVLSWLFSIIFGLFALSMFLMGNWLQAIALLGVVLVLLPPIRTLAHRSAGRPIPWWVWAVSIVILLAAFVWLGSLNKMTSIYKSPEVEARFIEMYDEKMEAWPVPYEDVFVDTAYGQVHVIVSGPEDAPPLLLLHASGVAGWSWLYNAEELSQDYRIYAIDTLGDVGKSKLSNVDNYPQNGQQQGELYAEIADKLGVEKAYVVGASEGGFIGTNYALLRIMIAQFFPLKSIQEGTFRWAFSDNPQLEEAFGEWFRLLMSRTFPQKARPTTFAAEQRQSLKVPVLLILGEKDNLVGDPEIARAKVQDIPDIRVEVLDTGHLIGAEQPEQVNALIIEFFEQR